MFESLIKDFENYHNLLDTKTKPNCPTWRRYTKKPGGKIFRKQELFE